jgi:hypothetical protein
VVRHREHQWLKIRARRDGEQQTPDDIKARYAARTAVTAAMDRLHMTVRNPALLAAAQTAVDTAFALGNTPADQVDAAGDQARKAHTALRTAAANHLYGS